MLRVSGVRSVDGDTQVRADVGLWAGLLGVRARLDPPGLTLSPSLAGWAPGPAFHVGGGRPEAEPALAADGDEAPEPEAAAPGPRRTPAPRQVLALPQQARDTVEQLRPLVQPLARMIRACPAAFHVRSLRLHGAVGLEDPASTGALFGGAQALAACLPRRVDLALTPDFTAPGIRGGAEIRVHVYLGRLLWALARFALLAARVWLARRLRGWWAQRRQPALS